MEGAGEERVCVCVCTYCECAYWYVCVFVHAHICVCVCVFCVTLQLSYCRLCVVMLVNDNSEYNDTVTRAFRELSVSGLSEEQISFSYLDVDKQEDFVKVFGKAPSSLRYCERGSKARPVSYACGRVGVRNYV